MKIQRLKDLAHEIKNDIFRANNYWLHNLELALRSTKPPTPEEALAMLVEARNILKQLADESS